MRITRRSIAVAASCFLILQASASACKQAEDEDDEEEGATEDAPGTPSPYTMSLDIDVGEEQPAETLAMDGRQFATNAGVNVGLAALVVGGVTFNIGAQMVVPIGLLTKALESEPIDPRL